MGSKGLLTAGCSKHSIAMWHGQCFFSKVLDLPSNASAISKPHGMRDLVSPADALSLGSETLFVFFVSLPEHSHNQSTKPVVH